ncbi:unnamed protein product [Microthlaspi erraticum]|uniref:Uncharacterized protein n=1 Tax=Microthlaspi erraticum TaxID=1685480 RepID=A0A6D2KA30_9BRAS|nr:unnamed protein product [Microthlaspi erraticum]
MHWEWKNCPTEWKGQYARGHAKPTIVLEAVASYDLWIWHAFFGPPGTLNDINVLHRSPVFDDILEGRAPKVSFSVNGHRYKMAYYLTDDNVTEFQQGGADGSGSSRVRPPDRLPSNVHNIMANRADIRDQQKHHQLKADLVEHIWNKFGH